MPTHRVVAIRCLRLGMGVSGGWILYEQNILNELSESNHTCVAKNVHCVSKLMLVTEQSLDIDIVVPSALSSTFH